MKSSIETSKTAFDILRDKRLSNDVRLRAFEEMLQLDTGWWGRGSLASFAHAVALAMKRYLQPRTKSTDALDWEGIAQDALLALFVSAHTIEGDPRKWLIGTTRNLVMGQLRRSGPEMSGQSLSDPDVEAQASLSTPSTKNTSQKSEKERARYETIREAIESLPTTRRRVLEKYYFENASTTDIAEALDMTPVAVRQNLSRARAQLKSLLDARFPLRQKRAKS